jgi:hypothetical protein
MYPPSQNTRSGVLEWAVAVLGASASVFLASQVHMNLLEQGRLQESYEEARRVVASISSSVKQAEEAYQKREIYLQKIEAQEARQAAFLNGLLELSKTDPDARTLVYRHKVGGDASAAEATPPSRTPASTSAPTKNPESAPNKTKAQGAGR